MTEQSKIKFCFEFHDIKFLDDIEGRLSWFDLTDGWFWLEVGDKELFRYTESASSYRLMPSCMQFEILINGATVAERITALQSRKTPSFTLLAEELTNRSHWLERSAARAPTTNWNTVRQSVTWLNQARPGWAHLG